MHTLLKMKIWQLEQMHTLSFVDQMHAPQLEQMHTMPLEQMNTLWLEQMHAQNFRSFAHFNLF